MPKAAVEELVMNAVQPRMHLGERPVSLVRVDSGPWLYLALLLVAAAFALLINQGQDFALMSVLVAALCALRVKSYAMMLTEEAIYMVHLRGHTIGSVEVIRPLIAVGFDRNLCRIELDGRPFWVRPLYLGADADNFERCLRAASTGIAVAY
jgi:uncharacterized membrane protein YjjP (DUF1212 family)